MYLLYNQNPYQNIIFANFPLLGSIPQEIRKSQGNIQNFEVFFYSKRTKIYNCQTALNLKVGLITIKDIFNGRRRRKGHKEKKRKEV